MTRLFFWCSVERRKGMGICPALNGTQSARRRDVGYGVDSNA